MKRIILVVSHLGAGGTSLCYSLAQSRTVEWVQDGIIYDDPIEAVESILVTKHKYSNIVGLYVNEVLYNYQISHKKIYETCEIVYLIREPRTSIRVMKPKDAEFALDYYIFRLRRIYEMAKQTKGAVFLRWEDLVSKRGMTLLTNKFYLPDNTQFIELKSENLLELPRQMLKKAEEAYELCLFRIKNKAQVVTC